MFYVAYVIGTERNVPIYKPPSSRAVPATPATPPPLATHKVSNHDPTKNTPPEPLQAAGPQPPTILAQVEEKVGTC